MLRVFLLFVLTLQTYVHQYLKTIDLDQDKKLIFSPPVKHTPQFIDLDQFFTTNLFVYRARARFIILPTNLQNSDLSGSAGETIRVLIHHYKHPTYSPIQFARTNINKLVTNINKLI